MIISANIQGLHTMSGRHKIGMLREMAQENNATIIALTETHLNEEILDAEIKVDGFEIFRADRLGAKKGGVALYIREDLQCAPELILSCSIGNIETLILYMKKLNLLFMLIYRPPTSENQDFRATISKINDEICRLLIPMPSIILTGDFNFPMIQWSSGDVSGTTVNIRIQCEILMRFTSELFMTQIIRESTRGNNILDLLYINDEDLILKVDIQDTDLSDHKIIMCYTRYCVGNPEDVLPNDTSTLMKYNFHDRKVKWESIRERLSLNWNEIFRNKSSTESYDTFMEILTETTKHEVPIRNLRRRNIIPRDRRLIMKKIKNRYF